MNVNEVTTVTMMCVFGRLMSQLADVNTQSAVGMCHFYDVVTVNVVKLVIFVHCVL